MEYQTLGERLEQLEEMLHNALLRQAELEADLYIAQMQHETARAEVNLWRSVARSAIRDLAQAKGGQDA